MGLKLMDSFCTCFAMPELDKAIATPLMTVASSCSVTEVIERLNTVLNIKPIDGSDATLSTSHADYRAACCAVIDGNNLIGLFSEREVMQWVMGGSSLADKTLAEVVEFPSVVLSQAELAYPDVVLKRFQDQHEQFLAVLDDEGQFKGVLTYSAIFRLIKLNKSFKSANQAQLLTAISTRIHESLNLTDILHATVVEVQQFLGCDRVSIYRILDEGRFQVVAESVLDNLPSFKSEDIQDPCFDSVLAQHYAQGRVRVVSDIYTENLAPCHLALLERLGIRAKILVPVVIDNHLWGVVSGSESSAPRNWHPNEVDLLKQLSIQVAIAIRHSQNIAVLNRQRNELKIVLDSAPDEIFRLDHKLHYQYVNAAVAKSLKTSAESLVGQHFSISPFITESIPIWKEAIQQINKTGKEGQITYKLSTHPYPTWLQARIVPEYESDGALASFLCITRNITEQKKAETKQDAYINVLVEWQNRYHAAQEASRQVLYEWDAISDEQTWGSNTQQLFGYSSSEMVRSLADWLERVHPDDIEHIKLVTAECLKYRKNLYVQYRWRHRDGYYLWIEDCAQFFKDREGNLNRAVGYIADISQRKQLETKLQESEAQLKQILDNSQDVFFLKSIDGSQTIYVSPAWEELYQTPLQEAFDDSQRWLSFIHPDDYEKVAKLHEKACRAEQFEPLEYRLILPDGSIRWIWNRIFPIKNRFGETYRLAGTNTDITEQKLVEEALRDNEATLNAVLDSAGASIGYYQFSEDGTWETVYDSESCQKIFGYPPGQLSFDVWRSNVLPKDFRKVYPRIIEAVKTEKPTTIEYRFRRPDGSTCWIADTIKSRWDQLKRCWFFTSVGVDISDRKQAEFALQRLNQELESRVLQRTSALTESEMRYRSLFEQAAVGISQCDYAGKYLNVNHRFCDMLGYSPSELLQMNWRDIVHPDDRDINTEALSEFHQGRRSSIVSEIRYLCKDGRVQWVNITVSMLFDTKGNIVSDLAVIEDINERKRIESEIKESELSYRTLAENLPGIVYNLFPEQSYEFCILNGQLIAKLNIKREDLNLRGSICLLEPLIVHEDRKIVVQALQNAIANRTPFQIEYRICNPETHEIHHLLEQGRTVVDGTGTVLHTVGVIFDVSQSKQTESKLRKINERLTVANTELARSTRLKDEFIANMSHELRTPLNSVLGLSEVLQEKVHGDLTEQQNRAVATIQRNGKHLLELINDILDLAKIESGELNLQIKAVSIDRVCGNTKPFIQLQAYKKQVSLSFNINIHPTYSEYIEIDERLIRQMLINLLSNAVKFTPRGGSVELNVKSDSTKQLMIFEVTDTGIGIAPEQVDNLFKPFVQVDSSLAKRYSGTGLGLALVRRIVELHQGTVTVKSTLGQGSCFSVTLPWKPTCLPSEISKLSPPSSLPLDLTTQSQPVPNRATILLVEDNADNLETLKAYLDLKGFDVMVARNGYEAVQISRTQPVELILMDIQMPDLDGLEAIRRIRTDERGKSIPILAVTALAMQGDREKCIAAGADDYISKPVSPVKLVGSIRKYLR